MARILLNVQLHSNNNNTNLFWPVVFKAQRTFSEANQQTFFTSLIVSPVLCRKYHKFVYKCDQQFRCDVFYRWKEQVFPVPYRIWTPGSNPQAHMDPRGPYPLADLNPLGGFWTPNQTECKSLTYAKILYVPKHHMCWRYLNFCRNMFNLTSSIDKIGNR